MVLIGHHTDYSPTVDSDSWRSQHALGVPRKERSVRGRGISGISTTYIATPHPVGESDSIQNCTGKVAPAKPLLRALEKSTASRLHPVEPNSPAELQDTVFRPVMTTAGTPSSIQAQFMLAAEVGDSIRLESLFRESSEQMGSDFVDAALLLSSKNGHLSAVQFLVETARASRDITDADGVTPLLWAQRHNHHDVENYFKSFLRTEFKRNGRRVISAAVKSQFVQAANDGALDSIRILFQKHGCSIVEAIDEHHAFNALHAACANGHLEIVRFLFTMAGANAEATNKDGCTPLHFACWHGQLEVVKYLVETAGANVEAASNCGSTPLHYASHNNQLMAMKYLVGVAGVNVEVAAKNGWKPLHMSCSRGHVSVVRYLVETARASTEATDNNGRTPMTTASVKGRLNIVQFLVETANANIETMDNKGWTPLLEACAHGHLNVVQYLLPISSANTKPKNGRTPLHVASRNGCLSIVQHLLSTSTDSVDTGDPIGNTALHRACQCGHLHLVQCLIEAGANVEVVNKHGNTAMHFASLLGHLELVVHLHSKARCNVHAANELGQTALHWASANGHLEVVRYLVEVAGVSVHTEDKTGHTPEAFAKSRISESCVSKPWESVVKYLESKRISQIFSLVRQYPTLLLGAMRSMYRDSSVSTSTCTTSSPCSSALHAGRKRKRDH
jgi:ankyrin repeat protein